jgi:hypothetical protein
METAVAKSGTPQQPDPAPKNTPKEDLQRGVTPKK